MIYFAMGLSSRNMYIDKVIKKYPNFELLIYNEETFNEFLNECFNNSLFVNQNIILLKNSNKIKTLEKNILKLNSLDDSNKIIIIDYECDKEPKDLIKLINDNKINIFSCFNEKENKNHFLKYLEKKLNIKKNEAEKLIEITTTNYYSFKNEIEKIETFLNDRKFNFEEIKNIVSNNSNILIFDLVNDILSKKEIKFPIEDDMAVFATLIKDLEILYKLKIANINISNYNTFKNIITDTYLFNDYSPYYVFSKQKYLNNFSLENINKLMKLAFKIELDIKTGIIPLKMAIELFIMQIIKIGA